MTRGCCSSQPWQFTCQSCLSAGEGCGLVEPKTGSEVVLGTFAVGNAKERNGFSWVSDCLWMAVGRAKAPQLLGQPGHPPAPPQCAWQGPARPARPHLTLQHGDRESQTSSLEVMRNYSTCTKNKETAGEK